MIAISILIFSAVLPWVILDAGNPKPAFSHIQAETKWTPFRRWHFKCIFLNENVWIPIKISLKFVPKGPINNIPALVQIIVWRRPGDKPLSEPMVVSLTTHKCVTRHQWVNNTDISSRVFNVLSQFYNTISLPPIQINHIPFFQCLVLMPTCKRWYMSDFVMCNAF